MHPIPIRSKKQFPRGKGKAPAGGKGWGLIDWSLAKLNNEFEAHRDSGVGICLGPGRAPGGLWLIDLEGDGPSAEGSFMELMGGELVETMSWKSTRGSHHLFVVGPDFLSQLQLAGAVEKKGTGGAGAFQLPSLPDLEFRIGGVKIDGEGQEVVKQLQSVCPPTLKDDGQPREWIGWTSIADIPPTATSWLKARARASVVMAAAKPPSARRPAPGGAMSPYIRKAVEDELKTLESTGEGNRNNALNTAAYNIGQLVAASVVVEADAIAWLTDAARRTGLADDEIAATIRSGLEAGKLKPRDLSSVGTLKPSNGYAARNGNGHATAPIRAKPSVEELDARLAKVACTDMGNGERLAARYGRMVRYCKPWGKWLVWDGKRFALDRTGVVSRLAKKATRKILAEAAMIGDDDERKKHAAHAFATQGRSRIDSMLAMASTELGIPVLPEDMDRDPWLFNCMNGTIDLRTGTLKKHDQADVLTQLCPIEFDPHATCRLWDATLDLFFAGDQKLIAYWQRVCGYALVGIIRDHLMPVAYGEGSNGKSTILGTLLEVFGPDYAMKAPSNMLMAKAHDSHPTDRADLFRKRLVVAIETESGRRLDEVMVKELTGGDRIRARRMREDFWEFSPTHTLVMATNHRPTIRGTDHGIWRRLRLVPFSVKVDGEKADTAMAEKLRAEFPGILAWAVRGCLAWQELGLNEPESVSAATAEYRAEQDVIGSFLAEATVQSGNCRTRCNALYAAYREWAEKAGEHPVTLKLFGQTMKERGFGQHRSNGKWYLGVGLKEPESDPQYGVVG
ncbi:phage/plasmid primase, P4 family [Paludisphaera mucosa]|uniref:Phage/plasmid primase, P4 family n=1 Tax=Paludisphaera mucosa TaxID=3030827 RepID=A0ABT6FMC9_9BACT|nr:phage/plasmid primase, P4 family [Paludisphaera mucosa]MDG3008533.1 phage/plasmid primase, P4 family [Paludisphaera mucosa]